MQILATIKAGQAKDVVLDNAYARIRWQQHAQQHSEVLIFVFSL